MIVPRMPRTWQRLALSMFGILIVVGNWRWATYHLYSMPETSVAAYQSITNNSFYVVGAIVVFMVTGKLIYDWKNETRSIAETAVNIIREKREEKVEIVDVRNDPVAQKFEADNLADPSYRPLSTLQDAKTEVFR